MVILLKKLNKNIKSMLDNHVKIFFRIGSLATFGTAGGLTVLYLTDWKLVLQYMPFYNGKFKKDDE